jgi:ribosome-associated protein
MSLEGKKLAEAVAELAAEKKASNIIIMDLRKMDYVADYFVIASAESYVQVGAISGNIEDALRKKGVYPYHTESDRNNNWNLLDYSDVVVHIFEEGTRKFYSLERIWGDAKFIEFGKSNKPEEKKIKTVVKKAKAVKGKKKNAGASKAKPKGRVKKSSKK